MKTQQYLVAGDYKLTKTFCQFIPINPTHWNCKWKSAIKMSAAVIFNIHVNFILNLKVET